MGYLVAKCASRLKTAGLLVTVICSLAATLPASAAADGQAIVNAAASQAGVPYCYGGGNEFGPTHAEGGSGCGGNTVGFDCTGLAIYAVYQGTGISGLPHDGNGYGWAAKGTVISQQSQLQPGDIVFFGGSFGNFEHAGIYAGGGVMWDADNYNVPVQEHSLAWIEGGPQGLPFVGAVRFTGGTPVTASHPSAIARSASSMDVFFRTPSGSLAEDYWTATGGWVSQGLPGGTDVAGDVSALHRSASSMDVFFRTPSGSLAEDYWTASHGWVNQGLPGGTDVAGDPSAIDRSALSMDVFFRTPSGSLAEDYWTASHGWVNQGLPGGTDVG